MRAHEGGSGRLPDQARRHGPPGAAAAARHRSPPTASPSTSCCGRSTSGGSGCRAPQVEDPGHRTRCWPSRGRGQRCQRPHPGPETARQELVSRARHHLSARAKAPFVAINCAAIRGWRLLEKSSSATKGGVHRRQRTKVGKVEMAQARHALPGRDRRYAVSLQAKILRLVQEKTVRAGGGRAYLTVDVRVVAATNATCVRPWPARSSRGPVLPAVGVPGGDTAPAPPARRQSSCWPSPSSSLRSGDGPPGLRLSERPGRPARTTPGPASTRLPELPGALDPPLRRAGDHARPPSLGGGRPPGPRWATSSTSPGP